MKRLFIFAISLSCCLIPMRGICADSGTTALPFLNSPVGARAMALSGATGALVDGVYTIFGNPAGLALLDKGYGSFTHQAGIAEVNAEVIGLAYPLPKVMTLGLGMIYRGQTDIDNNVPGHDPLKVHDLLVCLAVGKNYKKIISFGGALKIINSTLGEFSANALAFDIGIQYHAPSMLNIGLNLKNAGGGIKYIEHTDALPSVLSAAAGVEAEIQTGHDLAGGLDLNYGLNDSVILTQIGAEYTYQKTASVRLGYSLGEESLSAITVGAGVALEINGLNYRLDYALAPKLWDGLAQSDMEHTITLGIAF
ncbi:PorV/PorQ family protein [bacterium]|nr:PorV/PorQ family protein [bacterium]